MQRVLLFGLGGLLVLGLAGADLAARAASMIVTDVAIDSLDTVDHPVAASDEPVAAYTGEPIPVDDDAANGLERVDVLLVGTDSRAGLTDSMRTEMGANDDSGGLTDTMIWVQWLPVTEELRMVSIPRDLAVQTVEHGTVKINEVAPIYGDDGANELIAHVEDLIGADLEHYVQVNLAGLIALTDAIGGVEICIDEAIDDEKVGYLPAGCQVLDGIDASRFTRARHVTDSFGDGAHGRNARQQYFIRQAISKVLSAGTLTNPTALRGVLSVASDVATVDDGLTLTGMYELASAFRSTSPEEVDGLNYPVVGYYANSLYYDRPIEDAAAAVSEALRTGGPLPELDENGNLAPDEVMAVQDMDAES